MSRPCSSMAAHISNMVASGSIPVFPSCAEAKVATSTSITNGKVVVKLTYPRAFGILVPH